MAEQRTFNPLVQGSTPWRPTCGFDSFPSPVVDRRNPQLCSCRLDPSGHIGQLPSGWWRAKVYAGKDPLTGREIRFRRTRRTELEAQIELGKLLALARAGRTPNQASPSPSCSTSTSRSQDGTSRQRKATLATSAVPSSPPWGPRRYARSAARAAGHTRPIPTLTVPPLMAGMPLSGAVVRAGYRAHSLGFVGPPRDEGQDRQVLQGDLFRPLVVGAVDLFWRS
jgi:hypothetical protein